MSERLTEFERKTLLAIRRGAMISGGGLVAWTAAARRLEKRGLAVKWVGWHLTDAGRAALEEPAPPGAGAQES